jgi:pilus assembly protein TadC
MGTLNNSLVGEESEKLFENQLRKIFKPVSPNSGYVQKLKKTLLDKTEVYLEQNNPSIFLLLIIIGLIVTISLFLLINKIIGKQ